LKDGESKGREIVRDRKLNRWSDAVDVLDKGKHATKNVGATRDAKSGLV